MNEQDEIVYFVYLTTNKINGKMYIGQHSCKRLRLFTDGYIGSGAVFKNAVAKYGKENFERTILEYADSPEELNELESKYVDEEVINDDRFYNIKTGGLQNTVCSTETREKISNACKGRVYSEAVSAQIRESRKGYHHSEETRKKIGDANRNPSDETRKKKSEIRKGVHLSDEIKKKISESEKGEKSHWFGRKHTEESKKKISENNKGKICSKKTRDKMKQSWDYSKHFSEETRRKMSEAHKKRWETYQPSEEARQKMRDAHIGRHLSEETKKKISDTLKDKMKGEGNGMFGKHHSEETRRKISEARKGIQKRKNEQSSII